MTKTRARSGFTLVEVMIVVTILAVIAGIGVPTFKSYRDEAHDKACRQNKNQILHACTLRMMTDPETVKSLSELTGAGRSFQKEPKCPLNGTYTIKFDEATGYDVTCSLDASVHEKDEKK